MRHTFLFTTAAAALLAAMPAAAQDAEPPKAFTISGSAALVSDYRFRGVSQSDEEMAVQAGFTVAHETGFYAGVWGSNLSGWGTFGGANMELDVIGGFKYEFANGVTVDTGVTWYMYPGGADKTDFAEGYLKVSKTVGPVSVLGGLAYAPRQQALGRWYYTGADAVAGVYNSPGNKEDNWYVWGDVSGALPNTPITLKGHLGYSDGNPGLGPNGTSVAPTGDYFDWMIGADVAVGPVVLGIAYVDTSISRKDGKYLEPNFANSENGRTIAGPQAVFSVSAAF